MLKLVFLKHNLVFFIFLIEEKQRQEKKGKKKKSIIKILFLEDKCALGKNNYKFKLDFQKSHFKFQLPTIQIKRI